MQVIKCLKQPNTAKISILQTFNPDYIRYIADKLSVRAYPDDNGHHIAMNKKVNDSLPVSFLQCLETGYDLH